MPDLQIFSDPRFPLRFQYPTMTPRGHVVDVEESQSEESIRVHLRSQGSDEVYFEVRQYRNLLPQEEYHRHKTYLEKQFEAEGFSITGLADGKLAGSPTLQYSFQWGEKRRAVILFQQDSVTYRIIYDPDSPTNTQILSTVELIG